MSNYSDWRSDLREVMDDDVDDKEVKEKKVNNAKLIKINPKLGEAVEQLGGQIVEVAEVDTVDGEDDKEDVEAEKKAKTDEKTKKKEAQLKKRIVRMKMMAVNQGAGDSIVAGYEPEGELVEDSESAVKPKRSLGKKVRRAVLLNMIKRGKTKQEIKAVMHGEEVEVAEGIGATYAIGAGLNAVGEIAKAYGASQAAKGAIVGGALSGAGALAGGALNYAASRNKKKNDVKPKKKEQKESYEINPEAHKAAQKKSKMRNLARGNENPNEKAAAEKKAGGPKLVGEGIKGEDNEMRRADAADRRSGKKTRLSPSEGKKNVANMLYKIKNSPSYKKEEVEVEEGVMKFVKSIGKKKKEKKATMDATTDKLHDWRQKNSPEQKEREKYVSPFRPIVKEGDYHSGQGEKIQKRTKKWMEKKGQSGAPGLNAMNARTAEHKAKRGVKEEVELDELNRYGKETGKATGSLNKRPGKPVGKSNEPNSAVNIVRRMIRRDTGRPEGQQKKDKGAKGNRQPGDRKFTPAQTISRMRQQVADADAAMRDTRGT